MTDSPSTPGPHKPQRAIESTSAHAVPQRAIDPPVVAPLSFGTPPRRGVDRRSFARSIGWTTLSAFIPGLGLLKTRWKGIGVLMLLCLGLLVSAVGLVRVFAPSLLLTLAFDPTVLTIIWVGLLVVGLLWVASIVITHLALRPRRPKGWQRLVGAALVGTLTLLVAAPTAMAARTVYDTASFIDGVFADNGPSGDPGSQPTFGNAVDPWADKPRLNVLVLGGDSGQSRADSLGARTDSVMLASIDTVTGETTLISLPRQTQRMPFAPGSPLAKRWPRGFTNGIADDANYFLNAIYHHVPLSAPEAFGPDVKDPGAAALKESVGTALGLEVDYYAMINMDGFIQLINALGGITVNISRPVAVGGAKDSNTPPDRWLPPGPNQHLDGWDALWFARGRFGGDDYDRMARQRCMIQAIVQQADPVTVLTNYEALAKAGQKIVATDIPNSKLSAFLTLAQRVQKQPLQSMSFEHNVDGFSTVTPNWDLVRQRVDAHLHPPLPAPEPVPVEAPPTAPATAEPAASGSPEPEPPVTPEPPTLVDECAYNPAPRPEPQRR